MSISRPWSHLILVKRNNGVVHHLARGKVIKWMCRGSVGKRTICRCCGKLHAVPT